MTNESQAAVPVEPGMDTVVPSAGLVVQLSLLAGPTFITKHTGDAKFGQPIPDTSTYTDASQVFISPLCYKAILNYKVKLVNFLFLRQSH